jgi:hypothetical protein
MKMRIASLSLLTVYCLMLAVAPAMADTLYSNGPYNGNVDAWTINFGFSVSDSFTVASGSAITGISFVYWDASNTDLLTTVDVQIGTTSFGGATFTGDPVDLPLNGGNPNPFGYYLFIVEATFSSRIDWSGGGYVTLSNACTTSGCSVSQPIYWDENSGPSTAYENTLGTIPSESFTLTGTTGTTPEPSSIMLFGSGIFGLAGILRRKLNR